MEKRKRGDGQAGNWLDQPAKIPSRLVKLSPIPSNVDLILNTRFSNTDECF